MTDSNFDHCRLNQSLSWPFREVVATALYDFSPREPNQLPLRQGCQVLVIGKEGDSKGWWRGKTMDRVWNESTILICTACEMLFYCGWFFLSRLDSFRKSTSGNIRQHPRNYDVTIIWYSFRKRSQMTPIIIATKQMYRWCLVLVRCLQALRADQSHQLQVAHKAPINKANFISNFFTIKHTAYIVI